MLTAADQLRIISFLKRFGCNTSEALAYVETLKLGTTSIQELSRKLKRNRIAVYYNVQQLIEKGFLFEIRKGKKRFIVAEDAAVLSKIIEKRYSELHSLQNDAEYITQLLDSIHPAKHEVTVVKLYEEIEGFKKMLEETLHAKSEIMIFSNTSIFSKMVGEEYYENYFRRKAAHGIYTRIIYPPCSFAEKLNNKKEEYKIDLRFFSQNQLSESGFYLWDDTLAIKSLKENKRSCTIIENKEIARFFRENIFNHFWKEAQPLEEKNNNIL